MKATKANVVTEKSKVRIQSEAKILIFHVAISLLFSGQKVTEKCQKNDQFGEFLM